MPESITEETTDLITERTSAIVVDPDVEAQLQLHIRDTGRLLGVRRVLQQLRTPLFYRQHLFTILAFLWEVFLLTSIAVVFARRSSGVKIGFYERYYEMTLIALFVIITSYHVFLLRHSALRWILSCRSPPSYGRVLRLRDSGLLDSKYPVVEGVTSPQQVDTVLIGPPLYGEAIYLPTVTTMVAPPPPPSSTPPPPSPTPPPAYEGECVVSYAL